MAEEDPKHLGRKKRCFIVHRDQPDEKRVCIWSGKRKRKRSQKAKG